jgi:uncharacterized protein with PIN domain
MNELEIPCSECGTDLEEQTVHVQELPVSTNRQGHVRIAVCPTCEARYYPQAALTQLTEGEDTVRTCGDS